MQEGGGGKRERPEKVATICTPQAHPVRECGDRRLSVRRARAPAKMYVHEACMVRQSHKYKAHDEDKSVEYQERQAHNQSFMCETCPPPQKKNLRCHETIAGMESPRKNQDNSYSCRRSTTEDVTYFETVRRKSTQKQSPCRVSVFDNRSRC